jgi:3-phosphoshikimate 1-carboxyvinyltransferase
MKTDTLRFMVQPGGALKGEIQVPGDKSISHRTVIFGALAQGVTEVSGFLDGLDCLATRDAFRAMGVTIEGPSDGRLTIHGVGLEGLQAPAQALDVGNSGTSMRLLAGLLSAQPFDSVLVGDESLMRRPMRRIIEPLTQMGAHIEASTNGTAPLRIHGGQKLQGIDYVLPVASAQVKSALLLAGLYAQGETVIHEPAPSRDHTERMLQSLGYPLSVAEGRVRITGGASLRAGRIEVPGDLSSAAFFLIGASIAEGSDLLIRNVGVNPTRIGVIDILRLMGADISWENTHYLGAEPIADLHVRARPLHGIEVPAELVPLAIDEFPALFIAAACAQGETVVTQAAEMRVKESDRIQAMADGLQALGIQAQPTSDGIRIQGGELQGGTVESHGDHRIAMAFAMAGLCAREPIVINDCANVETSFPGFIRLAAAAGLAVMAHR